jgi:hypothetical protein
MDRNKTTYSSLADETRAVVDTETAAFHINRKPQTLRSWACFGTGPITPQRIHGRLAWPVAELRRIVGIAQGEDANDIAAHA